MVPAIALLIFAAPALAAAGLVPLPVRGEPRIRSVAYDPDGVAEITAFPGYQLMVEFAPGERIENVAVGDGSTWQITPNKRADLLFIKPLVPFVRTNMTVVTDLRRYAFELTAGGEPGPSEISYIVRFLYAPPAAMAAAVPPRPPNLAYKAKGARRVRPVQVFDDERFTYFKWSPGVPLPAIFVVGSDGSENLANVSVSEGYVVVEQIAERFVIRLGRETAIVTKEASPTPRTATSGTD